ncbi:MAG: nucleotidyltransferase domain-containing protein [Anaerolineales bacterium]
MNNTSLADKVSEQFEIISNVEAVTLGGSQSSGVLDQHSDIDLYVYSDEVVPIEKRQEIVKNLKASKADMNLTFWDTGDEWFDLTTGLEVDVMYWRPSWIEEQVNRVLVKHQASMGYTTCFWRTVKNSQILFDRNGWFTKLQTESKRPYPAQLKRAIVAKNHPVLRTVIPSYHGQIKKALVRKDLVSVNHRLAALLASYFDVLFALNEVLNPGEKKILRFVKAECSLIPKNLEQLIDSIFKSAAVGDMIVLKELDKLLDGLDELLRIEGFDPEQTLLAAKAFN